MARADSLNQGSTFLWTEHYADASRRQRVVERLRDLAFGTALFILAAGVAGFVAPVAAANL